MITRLLAGLIVTCAVSIGVAAAEEERSAKPVDGAPAATAPGKPEGRKIEWDDADATPDDKKVKPRSSESSDSKAEGAPASAKSSGAAASEKSLTADKPAESAKVSEASDAKSRAAEGSPAARRAKADDASPAAKPRDQPSNSGSARSAASAKPLTGSTTVTASETRAAKPDRVPSAGKPSLAAAERAQARERSATSETRVRTSRSTTADSLDRSRESAASSRRPAPVRTAQATRRPAPVETDPAVMDVAARQGTPISGGILCGGGSKWRCNWIEREHDKFYKFTKGHNWTDQTMATDYCASAKSMRVAAATRIKSIQGGCCGFVIVQVTCRR